MKPSDVPFYRDPIDFIDGQNTYPCSSQLMRYDPLQHRYFLTEEAINLNGIDVERQYISSSPNKMQDFISLVTSTVYDYIQYKVGWRAYQIMLYRIATCPRQIMQDKYAFRKQFEEVLVLQAKYLIENGVSDNFSGVDISVGKPVGEPPEDTFRANSDVSPRAAKKLEGMGLLRPYQPPYIVPLDTNKY